MKEARDIKIVDMNEDTWIGVDSYHAVYHIFVSYCTMTVSIQMLSDIMVHKINYTDLGILTINIHTRMSVGMWRTYK